MRPLKNKEYEALFVFQKNLSEFYLRRQSKNIKGI